jgi:alpha-beta hydrolase superfamily lysophospholipase
MPTMYNMSKIIGFLLILLSFKCAAIKPDSAYIRIPSDFMLSFKDTTISSSDNAYLRTWIINQDSNSKGVFLIAGGDAGNMSYSLHHAYSIFKMGYSVVLFDYRGFGSSSPFKYDSTFLYHKEYNEDFLNMINFCSLTYGSENLNILAMSMGSIFATRLNFDSNGLLILDSPIINPRTAVKHIKKSKDKKYSTPKLPKIQSHEKVLIYYSKSDKTVKLKEIESYVKSSSCLIFASSKYGHMEFMPQLRKSYTTLIEFAINYL